MVKALRTIFALILAVSLLAGCTCAAGEDAGQVLYEGNGFDTPEDAALCYMAGFKNQNFEQTLSAFAWETLADRFDFRAYLTFVRNVNPTSVPGMPAADGLLRSAVVEQLRSNRTGAICRALECYINDEVFAGSMAVRVKTEEEYDAYELRCNNGRLEKLAEMQNVRIYAPDDVTMGLFSSPRNHENFLKRGAMYGADEVQDIVIVADVGEELVLAAPTAARYGDRWYLVDTDSMTARILALDLNRQAFCVAGGKAAELVNGAEPVFRADALPEPGEGKPSYEGKGFASPEEAVKCYLEGLKNGNVQQMLQAYAWETQESRFSMKEYALYYVTITPSSNMRMPSFNPYMAQVNLGLLKSEQGRIICRAVSRYCTEGAEAAQGLADGYTIMLKSEEEVDEFIRAFDSGKAEKLKTMRDIRMIDPATLMPDRYDTKSFAKTLEKRRLIFGADELTDLIAVAKIDGATVIADPLLARYGDRWYMVSFNGFAFNMAGVSVDMQPFVVVNDGAAEADNPLFQTLVR